MSANKDDLTQFRGRKLPIAYFKHVINSGLVLRQKVLSVGSEMQLVVMIAMGDSTNHLGWTGPTRVTYAGADIPAEDWHFKPGIRTTGDADPVQGVDPWFPDSIPYNATPVLTVKLPVGEAETLQDVGNLAVIFECQKTENRDITGAVIGTGTTGSLAQVASDYGIHRWGLDPSRFDWPSWVHFQEFCATQIPKVVGQPETVTRFQGGPVFTDDTFQDVMDAVCLLSCSEWMDYGGKIYLITPENRAHVHTFIDDEDGINEPGTGNIVTGSLQMYPVDERQLVNKVTMRYRDLDHPELKETTIIVERRELRQLYGDVEDELYLGPSTAHQAKRVGEYELARTTDYPVRGELRGMGDSDHVIPGDFIIVRSHRFNWIGGEKMFIVVDKDEESDGSADAARFVLEERVNGIYRDDVDLPLPASTDDESLPNPYAAPPLVEDVNLVVVSRVTDEGSWIADIEGQVIFGAFPRQRGVVWMRTAATAYVPVAEVTPRSDGVGYFQVSGVGSATADVEYFFKVVAESPGRSSRPLADAVEYSTVVDAPDAPGAAVNLLPTSYGLWGVDGTWHARIGVDFDFPPSIYSLTARIEYKLVDDVAWIDSGMVVTVDEDGHGYAEISGVGKGSYYVRVIVDAPFVKGDPSIAPYLEVEIVETPRLPAPINGFSIRDEFYTWRNTWDPGLLPQQVLPQGQEIKRYRVRVRRGSFVGTIVRQFDVDTLPAEFARWTQLMIIGFPCGAVATSYENGGIYHPGDNVYGYGCVWLSDLIRGDADLFFTFSHRLPPRQIMLVNADGTTTQSLWSTSYSGGVPQFWPETYGELAFRPLPKQRVGMSIRRQQVEYIGPQGSVILKSGEKPFTGDYRIQLSFGLLNGEPQELAQVEIFPSEREIFIYDASMQAFDFSAYGEDVQDEVFLEIRQLSLNPNEPEGLPLYIHGVL